MRKVIEVSVKLNRTARQDEPKEYINLYEVWGKAEYKIPHNRWVKDILKRFNIKATPVRIKTNKPGRNVIGYYIPLAEFETIKPSIEIRKHCEIHYKRAAEKTEELESYTNLDKGYKIFCGIIDGKMWFVAKQISRLLIDGKALILSLTDMDMIFVDSSIFGFDNGEKLRLISESGLYEVVYHSNDKNIREIKSWLITEALPHFREQILS